MSLSSETKFQEIAQYSYRLRTCIPKDSLPHDFRKLCNLKSLLALENVLGFVVISGCAACGRRLEQESKLLSERGSNKSVRRFC